MQVDPQRKIFSITYSKIFTKPKTDTYEFSQIGAVEFKLIKEFYTATEKKKVESNNRPTAFGDVVLPIKMQPSKPTYKLVTKKKTRVNYKAALILLDGNRVEIGDLSKKECKFLSNIIGCKFIEAKPEIKN